MLEKAIELMGEGYMSNGQIVDDVTRKYGLSPADVLTEKERRKETLDNLQIIMDNLTETQRRVLELTGIGLTVREMEEELGIDNSNISKIRQSISTRLFDIADEDKIQELVFAIGSTKSKENPEIRKRLLDEYERRISVREALKKLLVLLTPPESTKEMNGSVNLPAYTFEREAEVGVGMREAIEDGRHIMKTKIECHIPEYLESQFGDKSTCCMICATCRRNKDIPGRCPGSRGGLWHTEDVMLVS